MDQAEYPYDFELGKVTQWISQNGFKKILLQAAPGLLQYLPRICSYLRDTLGIEVQVDGRGRFGACDVETSLNGFDAVVHFGHTGFVTTSYPVLYIPAFSKTDTTQLFPKVLEKLKGFERIGLAASVQHIKSVSLLYEYLFKEGKKPFVGKPGKRCLYDGQVVGCDYLSSIRVDSLVDAHVIISGGKFHAIGLALSVFKPVLHVDPYMGTVGWVSKNDVDRINRHRGFAALTLQSAKKVALVDVYLPGQHTEMIINKVEAFLRKMKPFAIIDTFVIDVLSNEFLFGLRELGYEIAVTAGCPRFSTDDFDRSPIPIFEAREVYGLYLKGLNVDKGVFILQ